MKKPEEAMQIFEAYDLTGSLRGAAALAGCDHKTVARLVAAREAAGGGLPERARRRPLVDPFAEKIDELVDRSHAHVRADKAHETVGDDSEVRARAGFQRTLGALLELIAREPAHCVCVRQPADGAVARLVRHQQDVRSPGVQSASSDPDDRHSRAPAPQRRSQRSLAHRCGRCGRGHASSTGPRVHRTATLDCGRPRFGADRVREKYGRLRGGGSV